MKAGIMIRLVDMVLTLLFGFLFVTDYEAKSHIPIPRVKEGEVETQQDVTVHRFLEVLARTREDAPYYWYGNPVGEERILRKLNDATELVEALREEAAQHGEKLELVIAPLRGARVKWVVEAYDICREVGIAKPVVRIDRDYRHMTARG